MHVVLYSQQKQGNKLVSLTQTQYIYLTTEAMILLLQVLEICSSKTITQVQICVQNRSICSITKLLNSMFQRNTTRM